MLNIFYRCHYRSHKSARMTFMSRVGTLAPTVNWYGEVRKVKKIIY